MCEEEQDRLVFLYGLQWRNKEFAHVDTVGMRVNVTLHRDTVHLFDLCIGEVSSR